MKAMSDLIAQPCPCGSGGSYQVCCGPLHHGERQAETAEELIAGYHARAQPFTQSAG